METSKDQMPTLLWLFQIGGLPLVAASMGLMIVGIGMIIRPQQRSAVIAFAILAMIPGLWAMLNVYLAASDFASMASSQTPPKPAEFAAVTGRAMANGFYGLLATLVSSAIAISLCIRGRSHVHNP